jgi:hypothetical protein
MNIQYAKNKIKFKPLKKLSVEASFCGGNITSDGGLLLLKEVEKRFNIINQFSKCFKDWRNPIFCKHTLYELLAQRIYALCAGYEDLNDHDFLKEDNLYSVLVEKDKLEKIAGKSTLNRLELSSWDMHEAYFSKYKKIAASKLDIEKLFIKLFIQSYKKPPKSITIDFDASDNPIHGNQESKFFHGYYKKDCYLPLFAFCNGFLLYAKLRPSNIDGSQGVDKAIKLIVSEIRKFWPKVKIIIRGDSGFCREDIMKYCEDHDVDYIFGESRNPRLLNMIKEYIQKAKSLHKQSLETIRLFRQIEYQTLKSWSKKRNVIAKIEYHKHGSNIRFIVTTLLGKPKILYEKKYCERGDMENRIKEHQLYLFSLRTSSSKMNANQLRLWFSSIAYNLLHLFRNFALRKTKMKDAQCSTIRLRFIKLGATIKISCRRVFVAFSEVFTLKEIFVEAYESIQKLKPKLC